MYLEGEDAKRFHEYMENPPPLSESARKLLADAAKMSKKPEVFDPPV
jgi:hypothetical protein